MAFITVPGGFACPCRLFSSEARVAAADGYRDGHWSEGGFSSALLVLAVVVLLLGYFDFL